LLASLPLNFLNGSNVIQGNGLVIENRFFEFLKEYLFARVYVSVEQTLLQRLNGQQVTAAARHLTLNQKLP
jgi:hypothetical protein